MRKWGLFILLLLPLFTAAQKVSLGVSKDLGWAKWTYETLEFKDDCTILRGYFIPSKNGCWVMSKMDETLKTDDEEYRIIHTTLPIIRHPRTTFKGGVKVEFEDIFEPIFSNGETVELTSHKVLFTIPFKRRESSIPFDELFSAYAEHIDKLIENEKYNIAAYLLNQYVKKFLWRCSPKARKRISESIISKYRVRDFFLNVPFDDGEILPKFEEIHNRLGYNKDERIFRQLKEICSLQVSIRLNMNGRNLSKVIQWCETLISMVSKYGKYNKCYEYALSQYRKSLIMDGQIQRIPEVDKEIIEVCSTIYNPNGNQYLERLMNIASDLDIRFSKTSYDTSCGINIWKEVRDKAKKNYPNTWRYASALKEIADYNYRYKHFDVALMQYCSIDSLFKEKRNDWIYEVWCNHDILTYEQSIKYIDLIQKSISKSIGYCYYQKGDITSAIRYDRGNPYYHYILGDYKSLISLCNKSFEESMEGLKDIIINPTILSPGAYYDEVFDIAYTPVLTTQIPYFAYKTGSKKLCEMAYDGTLVTKGFRLTAENRLRQYLKKTRDSISIEYDTRIKKEMRTYQSMIESHNIEALEKHWEIVHLQRNFISYLDSISILGKTYFPRWTDVRNSLKKGEIAIEFVELSLWDESNSMYVAFTLSKDYESPHVVPIATKDCVDSLSDYNVYSNAILYNIIWKPLEHELIGISRVYFSPVGNLHILGIENAVPPTTGKNLSHIDFYRLSSTRELININKNDFVTHNAILYGGLRYSLAKQHTEECFIDSNLYRNVDVGRMKHFKGSLEDIYEETSIEVDSITKILLSHNYKPVVYKEHNGTEESFKALSGCDINILHISTHGFYWNEGVAEKRQNERHMAFLQNLSAVYSQEDRSLSRSGLLMSGSKWAVDGNEVGQGIEDGILTAREIAKLDLDNVSLVSLSACQTGLGDLMSSEGVFGLQRGFKKAGVKSILMTLWEVDDVATRLFMTEFYKYYLSTGNKYMALKTAQRYLLNYVDEDGKYCYNNPKYWAAFVLLDAN